MQLPRLPAGEGCVTYPLTVATNRSSSVRGTRIRGESGTPRAAKLEDRPIEPVANPEAPRSVIDYALHRRKALEDVFNGGGLRSDVCDADPYLLRAAKHHGEPTTEKCPICKRTNLDHVTYVYGDELGPYAGRIRSTDELAKMSHQFGEFRVYVVEVCQECSWNFLLSTYVLGDGVPRRPLPKPRDILE